MKNKIYIYKPNSVIFKKNLININEFTEYFTTNTINNKKEYWLYRSNHLLKAVKTT